MTPIYRSPDYSQTMAIQALLLDHKIQTSVIETRKSSSTAGSNPVIWHELWLHQYADVTRAKTIITQREFTTYKSNMSAFRSNVQNTQKIKFHSSVDTISITDKITVTMEDTDASKKYDLLIGSANSDKENTKPREDLIPINNKRVFKRLGLLLGYSEEEINKLENQSNKLYRPWDAGELMERVKNLKQKCS